MKTLKKVLSFILKHYQRHLWNELSSITKEYTMIILDVTDRSIRAVAVGYDSSSNTITLFYETTDEEGLIWEGRTSTPHNVSSRFLSRILWYVRESKFGEREPLQKDVLYCKPGSIPTEEWIIL